MGLTLSALGVSGALAVVPTLTLTLLLIDLVWVKMTNEVCITQEQPLDPDAFSQLLSVDEY